MKNPIIKFTLLLSSFAVLSSCNNSDETAVPKKDKDLDSIEVNQKVFSPTKISDKAGIIGIFDMPEMLTICKKDSAPMKDVSFKVAKDYGILEEEMNFIGAELDGAPGMITYNNDTSNFIFECVLPIKTVPKKQPKNCTIVALETTPMLIYNFYGPVQKLFSAYDILKKHMASNKLKQCGPMREFYLFDPTIEKDPAKWQTRIMIPVGKTK